MEWASSDMGSIPGVFIAWLFSQICKACAHRLTDEMTVLPFEQSFQEFVFHFVIDRSSEKRLEPFQLILLERFLIREDSVDFVQCVRPIKPFVHFFGALSTLLGTFENLSGIV